MSILKLNRENAKSRDKAEVKVIQFGEGNFLRAFADWMIDILNDEAGFAGSVQIVQPLPQGMGSVLNEQDGLYHVILQGIKEGKELRESRLISCVHGVIDPYTDTESFFKSAEGEAVKIMISNTTESGIAFFPSDTVHELAQSFPGKLTQWLYHRFQFYKGDPGKGLIFLPCELIDKNGAALKAKILEYASHWALPEKFSAWVNQNNTFCNTLVDRIVPGFPRDNVSEIQHELGFADRLVVTAEPFHLWVVEGPGEILSHFPIDKTSLHVVLTNDLSPYRSRKVRILNGAHTTMVPLGFLKGFRTVREVMQDDEMGRFIRETIEKEIVPTLDLSESELKQFAGDVVERFLNPFIRHELASIALNSISKFEVRVLPTITSFYERKGALPPNLMSAFAALLVFYRGTWNEETVPLNDSPELIEGFRKAWLNESAEDVVDFISRAGNGYRDAFKAIPSLRPTLARLVNEITNSRVVLSADTNSTV